MRAGALSSATVNLTTGVDVCYRRPLNYGQPNAGVAVAPNAQAIRA
jgi:hypothetical protein